jgi:hypothetical protein
MAIKSLLSVSVILRYTKGSCKFSSISPSATNERLYEFGDAINGLQDEKAKYIDKALCYRIFVM